MQLFVEAARIYSLADGVAATNTLERLAGVAGLRGDSPHAELEAWVDAFRVIQRLRLALNGAQHARGETLHNHLNPATLDEEERRGLKHALRQARNLQARLARDFSVRRCRLRRLIQAQVRRRARSPTLASHGRSGLP